MLLLKPGMRMSQIGDAEPNLMNERGARRIGLSYMARRIASNTSIM